MKRLRLVESILLTACLSALPLGGCVGDAGIVGGGVGSGGGAGARSSTGGGGPGGSTGTGSSGPGGTGNVGVGVGGGGGASGNPGSGSTTGVGGGPVIMPPPDALPVEKACVSNVPGPRLLRRLAGSEFAATVRTIFNDTTATAPVSTVFSDPQILGFSVDANALLVQGLNASQLMDNAEAIAAWAAANNKLSQFGNCTTHDAVCGQKFVKALGQRAFRTRLADSDPRIAAYTALFNAETTYSDGAQAVIAALLQSPHFLYRSELGARNAGATEFTLTPPEIATSLAYLLTGNMPDDALTSAADAVAAGTLTVTAMIDQQATRLLAASDPRSQTAVMGFMNGWLGLDRVYTNAKDDTVFMLTKALRDDMAAETRSLILEAFNGTGGLSQLLTADHSFLNRNLATYYGLPNAASIGTTFASVPFTASTPRDGGLLAQASILVGYSRPEASSPTQRGHLVRTRMLCQDVPPPPANLDTKFQPAMNVVTTRDRFEKEHSVGVCYSCHQLMDDIGYGFEHYDGFGRRRETENGAAINAAGKLVNVSVREGSPSFTGLSGAGSLQAYLAQSEEVKSCLVRHWAYYAYGSSSWAEDGCTYGAIRQEAAGNGFALKSVLMGIIHAPHFTRRTQDP